MLTYQDVLDELLQARPEVLKQRVILGYDGGFIYGVRLHRDEKIANTFPLIIDAIPDERRLLVSAREPVQRDQVGEPGGSPNPVQVFFHCHSA